MVSMLGGHEHMCCRYSMEGQWALAVRVCACVCVCVCVCVRVCACVCICTQAHGSWL